MVNVGIIGAGRIGKVHVESICTQVKDAKVKLLADPFMNETTEAWAKDMGVEAVTKDYKEILADPEIDAVLICSSTDTHSPISVEAIKAGKHVFCEKPIDHDVDKIKDVIEALKDSKVKYQVGFNRRFDHNFEAVRQAVVDGKVGDPHIIKITSRDPEPPCAEYVKVSGGIFLDMTIHDFDMVRFLAGCDATEVYVEAAVLVDPAIGEAGDVDTAVITLKMENGAIAVIDNSRKAVYGYDQRAEVFGSKGMVAVSNNSTSSAIVSNAEGVTGEKPLYFFLERYMAAYAKEIKCFIEAIENDTDTPLGVMDAVVFGMIGDVVEYGQWKTHVRQESLIFAGGSIGTKVGAGIASAVMTGLLSLGGYISTSSGSVTQPDSALYMIINIYKVGPLIVAGGVLLVLIFYHLDEQYPQIMKDLIEREAKGEM